MSVADKTMGADMARKTSTISDVIALVQLALDELKREDGHLFKIHANERSITHRFAVYLERLFEGWSVDCEYSRIGRKVDPKRMTMPSANSSVSVFDTDGSRVYPDIVIHHRGKKRKADNLLVIEVKTTWSQVSDKRDLEKLMAFTGRFPIKQPVVYRFGLFVKLDEKGNVVKFEPFDGVLAFEVPDDDTATALVLH